MILNRISAIPGMGRLIRRGFHLWFLLSRGLTLGVRAAVIDRDGRVCLVRHTYVAGWQLPGGGVEIGEDAGLALARELREEAAVEITGPPLLHGIVSNRAVSRRDHVLIYVVRDFASTGPKVPDREIAEAAFWPLDALPDGTTPGTRERLAEIVAGRPPRATW
ncbi:MAG: mismatch repair protein MutT [Enterovirga sp.]|nr:mismatch repair protein MutT [Enterovirga sp.]